MNLEVHIIQNFPPSNLNRDDTGTPKDCVFGGVRRARISSQCLKRSVRWHPAFAERIREAGGDVGQRTKLVQKRIVESLEPQGVDEHSARTAAAAVVQLLGLKFDKKHANVDDGTRTEYLLYLGENEIRELASIAGRSEVIKAATKVYDEVGADGNKFAEKLLKQDGMKPIAKELEGILKSERVGARSYAADIALFGRMVADDKNMNVDAACQVAHAISTNRVDMDIDFYTAVDDFNVEDSGAGMMGISEFTSACFYRYANLDIDKLSENLGYNRDLLAAAVRGFAEASVFAVPSGKQNSTAAQSPPAYVRLVVRHDGFPWSLAGAFSAPAEPDLKGGKSLEQASVEALEDYFERLRKCYGDHGIGADVCFGTSAGEKATNMHDAVQRIAEYVETNAGTEAA